MATNNFTAKAFATDFDKHWTANSDDHPPALVINPAATTGALLGAVHSRAERLHGALSGWALNSHTETDACDLARTLEPLAQEIVLLLDGLGELVHSPNEGAL